MTNGGGQHEQKPEQPKKKPQAQAEAKRPVGAKDQTKRS